jgi:hypothetical protein
MKIIPYGRQYIDNKDIKFVSKSLKNNLITTGDYVKTFESQISKLVNTHDVKWIIATGAPFNLLYFAADFIRLNPRYKLWADLRDPWLDAKNYGMPQLNSKRKAAEWRKAEIVLKYASVVSCPTLDAIRIFDTIDNGKYSKNLLELRHFFDPKDFDIRTTNVSSNKIKVVYGGDIYPGAERFVHQMLEDLRQLKKDFLEVYNRMDIRFYSDSFSKVQTSFSDLEVVHIGPSIGENIFDEIANSDWCIILLTDFNRHFFTTKYFEYQPFEKPFLYLGPEGKVSNEIRDQKAGLNWEDFLKELRTADWSTLKHFERGSSSRTGSLQVRTDELLEKISEFD